MNRRINTDTKSHRNHNHIIDADFSKLKEMRQATQNAKSQQRSHAKRNATRQEILWLAERNDQRTKNDDNNNIEIILSDGREGIAESEINKSTVKLFFAVSSEENGIGGKDYTWSDCSIETKGN